MSHPLFPPADRLKPEDLLAHTDWMRSLARTLVSGESQADDLVQDAFVAVAERPPEHPRTLTAWLRCVVTNLARKDHRSTARRRRREAFAARPERDPVSPAGVIERAELHQKVVEIVLDLPEPYRRTILLTYFEGLSPVEAARCDGVPIPTVRARLQRGLDRLRAELDRRHGGGREDWLGAMLPLAGLKGATLAEAGLPAAATAGGSAEATAGAPALAAATPVAAPAITSAASGGVHTMILGGTLMTQKALLSIAGIGLVTLAVGIGVGRYASSIGPEDAKSRFGLVDAKKLSDAEALLARTRTELDGLKAAHAGAIAEKDKLAERARALEEELKADRDRAAAAAETVPGKNALPVSFGKYSDLEALASADWPEMAKALKTMNGLFLELLEGVEAGLPVDPELQKKIAAENAKLIKLAAGIMGKIPTHSAVNGEFSHPLVLSNLMSALLEDSGMPLTKAQLAKVAGFGDEFEEKYARLQEGYTKDTPRLEKLIDELELKRDCIAAMRGTLTPEQLEAAYPPELRDALQLDVLSPGIATILQLQHKEYASVDEARRQLQESFTKQYGVDGALSDSVAPSFDAWLREMEPMLAPVPGESRMPRLDQALAAGRARVNLLRKLLEVQGLDEKVRAAILAENGWLLPRVVEKKE